MTEVEHLETMMAELISITSQMMQRIELLEIAVKGIESRLLSPEPYPPPYF